MQETPPFSMRNRPWLSQGCIDAINERYMSYIGKMDPADRENLRVCPETVIRPAILTP